MKWIPRAVLALVLSAAAPGVNSEVPGGSFPSRPITIIVPYPAGAGTDATARIIARSMSERLRQPVVVQNRAGAAGIIGVDLVVKAPPDGYTLLLTTANTLTSNVSLYKNLPYDPGAQLAPISLVGNVPVVLAAFRDVPANNAPELVALAKAHPGKLTFGSAGNGTVLHLSGELFKSATGTNIVHVPYKGIAPSVAAAAAGETQLVVADLTTVEPMVQAKRLKILGNLGAVRSPLAPRIPIMADVGIEGVEVGAWSAMLAPAGTPETVMAVLGATLADTLRSQDVRDNLLKIFVEPQGSTPDQLRVLIDADTRKWRRVIAEAGIKID
ncbi:tripartite tricarboxylate transporter substrate binding protein [Pigmentiphaga sp. H8]|uniref:Bug family tripartite tricarboxylate transporter substrate binding protein n=1 Tax=Pigmentiphaga sp. H8 TaxID=2488560 RepID=UPI001375A69E|nr:tripartite tricarboxylate transporter substrate-binding protein [Pigmentiphaga sp. H8]